MYMHIGQKLKLAESLSRISCANMPVLPIIYKCCSQLQKPVIKSDSLL